MTFFSYQTQINLFIPNLEDFQKPSKKTQKIRNSNNKTLFFKILLSVLSQKI